MNQLVIATLLGFVGLIAGQLVIPGGEHALATNDEMLVRVLSEVQPLINARLNSPYLHRIGHVEKASAQIVNGLIYHVSFELGQTTCLKTVTQQQNCDALFQTQTCTARIFSQPWDNVIELSELQCAPAAKKEGQLDGGLYEVDTEDEAMKHALLAVETEMSNKFSSPYVSQVGKVLQAKAQVVAGIMYHLTFKFGQTYLLKSAQTTEEPHRRSEVIRKFETCQAQIWAKPGNSAYELVEFKCDVSGEFYEGGEKAIDVHDADMLAALSALLGEMNTQLHTTHANTLGKVIEAKAQVVSGMKYTITFELGQRVMMSTTEIVHQWVLIDRKICHAEIWSQPWLNKTELTSLSCEHASA